MSGLDAISPLDMSDTSPSYEVQIYAEDNYAYNHVSNGQHPINVDTNLATSYMNPPGPSSSVATTPTPNTSDLVSPSHRGYASSPSLLAVTPPPARTLCPVSDVFPQFTTSTPERVIPFNEHRRGPMVPQKRYKPHTSSDRRRYVDEVNLEQSISFFMQRPDEEGIPLRDAMHGRFARLLSREELMFKERGPSISVRINVSPALHSKAVPQLCALMLYKTSGRATNPGAVRYPPGISATLLGLLHVRNLQRM